MRFFKYSSVAVVLFLGLWTNLIYAQQNYEIDAPSFYMSLQNDYSGPILDVRTPVEIEETGIIEGTIIKNFRDADFRQYIEGLDISKNYIVYCRSGNRSMKVINLMREYNINALSLAGGMNEWLARNYPVVDAVE